MINRRNVLLGTATTLAASAVPVKAIASILDDQFVTVYNRIGLPCTYSKSLASDLLEVYGFDARKIVEGMFGTKFKLELWTTHPNTFTIMFKTNDARDVTYIYKCKDDVHVSNITWLEHVYDDHATYDNEHEYLVLTFVEHLDKRYKTRYNT